MYTRLSNEAPGPPGAGRIETVPGVWRRRSGRVRHRNRAAAGAGRCRDGEGLSPERPLHAEESLHLSDSPRRPKRRPLADHPGRGDEAGPRQGRRNRQRQPAHGPQSGRSRGLHPVGRYRQGRQAGPRPGRQPDRPPEFGEHVPSTPFAWSRADGPGEGRRC